MIDVNVCGIRKAAKAPCIPGPVVVEGSAYTAALHKADPTCQSHNS